MSLYYRNDIDGVRAIAVLSVVLYHAGLGFPGGFVGVDVFFVISGFLITSLLAADIQRGAFSPLAFYERRARRILPCLLIVIGASLVVGWITFMPPELVMLGKSASAAILFYSNFFFRNEAGYFDTIAATKPLLHTWSLAVEEQFYLVMPALLCCFRHQKRQLWFIGTLTLLSFVLSVWCVENRPVDAFYLLPSRFWELGVGALLAFFPQIKPSRPLNAGLSVASGCIAIGVAALTYDTTFPFPGIAALLPCLGTVLVLIGGKSRNWASAFLSCAPLTFIGRISYSLYLWHWPIIVFYQYRTGRTLTPSEGFFVIGLSIGLAALSWTVVEQPVRRRLVLSSPSKMLFMMLVPIALLASTGFISKKFHGFPERLPTAVAAIYAAKDDTSPFGRPDCFTDGKLRGPSDADVRAGRLCDLGDRTASNVSFLVWGDSHAGAIAPGIGRAAESFGRRGLVAGEGGCPPLLKYDNAHSSGRRQDECINRNDAVLDLIKKQHIPLVFMVARWPREVLGAEYGQEGPYFDPKAPYKTMDRSSIVGPALDHTLSEITKLKVQVVLVADVPEVGYDVPYALGRAMNGGKRVNVNPPRSVVEERRRLAMELLGTAAKEYGAEVVDPIPIFCNATDCMAEIDGRPLYTDSDHITRTTAEWLSNLFIKNFEPQTLATTSK